jgi:hypothetical protein
MCSRTELWSILALAAFALVAARSALLQHRFAAHVKREFPLLWVEFGNSKHWWSEDDDPHRAACFSYVIQGPYRGSTDQALVEGGNKSRRWHFASIAALFLAGGLWATLKTGPNLGCLWPF